MNGLAAGPENPGIYLSKKSDSDVSIFAFSTSLIILFSIPSLINMYSYDLYVCRAICLISSCKKNSIRNSEIFVMFQIKI